MRLAPRLVGLGLAFALPLNAAAYTTLPGGTWNTMTLSAGTYHVTGNVTIPDNQQVTLEPGVVMKFAPGVLVTVNGTFDADGVEGNRVTLTSRNNDSVGEAISESTGNPQPGDWDGINAYGYSVAEGLVDFDYTDFSYAGGAGNSDNAGIYCAYSDFAWFRYSSIDHCAGPGLSTNFSNDLLDHCLFRHNQGDGFRCANGAPSVRDNEFHNNLGYGANIYTSDIGSYGGNTGSANTLNGMRLQGQVTGFDSLSTVGPNFPFILSGQLTVNDNAHLRLEAGCTFKSQNSGLLYVYGTLDMDGGPGSAEVILTSIADDGVGGDTNSDGASTGSPGDWLGIETYGYSGNEGAGTWTWASVYYGGQAGSRASVILQYADYQTLSNCRIGHSAHDGLYSFSTMPDLQQCSFSANGRDGLNASSSTPFVTDCSFEDNTRYGSRFSTCTMTDYSGNTGSGNGINGFAVQGAVAGALSWSQGDPAFPYLLPGLLTVNDNASLTLNAGCVFKGENNGEIHVYGTLTAPGGSGSPVVFSSYRDDALAGDTYTMESDAPAPGDWKGLYAYGYSGNEGIVDLDYTRFRYGGNVAGGEATVYLAYCETVSLDDCVVEYGSMHGVRTNQSVSSLSRCLLNANGLNGFHCSSGTPFLVDNQFDANGQYGAWVTSSALTDFSGNDGSGNGINGLALNGNTYVSQTWSGVSASFPFILHGTVSVNDNTVLDLAAGTLFKCENESQLSVYGTLNILGTESQPVRFASWREDGIGGDTNGDGASLGQPGDWKGLYVYGYSGNEGILDMAWGELYHGGANAANTAGIQIDYSDGAHLRDSRVQDCARDGVATTASSPLVERSAFRSNLRHGIYCNSTSRVPVYDSVFEDNGAFGVYMDNSSLADLSGNTGSGNGTDGFGIKGTVQVNSGWSTEPGFPVVLTGQTTVNDNVTLSLQAGTVIKGMNGAQLRTNGTLDSNGNAIRRVTFTSLDDDSVDGDTAHDGVSSGTAGYWNGLLFHGYSGNEGSGNLQWTEVAHGGGGGQESGIRGEYTESLHLEYCRVEDNLGDGLYTLYSSASAKGSIFRDNTDDGIQCNQGSLALGSCSEAGGNNCLYDNGGYALNNTSNQDIEACGNYWGSADPAAIEAAINHQVDQPSYGLVNAATYNSECTAQVPVLELEITVVNGIVELNWSLLPEAIDYTVYSSTEPWSGYTIDLSGSYDGNSWSAPAPGPRASYVVVATVPE